MILEKTNTAAGADIPGNTILQAAAIQAASPIVLALMECNDELRSEAVGLIQQLAGGELDEYERIATTTLLVDILFPNADDRGVRELDLEETEQDATKDDVVRMNREEELFAERLQAVLTQKGMTQTELADKVGIGQPAISMMLNRSCRPQRKTIVRFAEALDVTPEELWPAIEGGAETGRR